MYRHHSQAEEEQGLSCCCQEKALIAVGLLAWIIHARPERAARSSHSACPGWLLARRKRTRLAHWYTRPPTFSSSRRKVSSCRRADPALTSQRRKVSSNQ